MNYAKQEIKCNYIIWLTPYLIFQLDENHMKRDDFITSGKVILGGGEYFHELFIALHSPLQKLLPYIELRLHIPILPSRSTLVP